MNELAPLLSELTPGAYGVWAIALMLAGFLTKEWRETRKLSSEDRQARREGYARQVEELSKENRALRTELTEEREHSAAHRKQCHVETDQLRTWVRNLEDELEGYKRKFAELSLELMKIKDGKL